MMAFLKSLFSGVTQNDVPYYGDIGEGANKIFTDDLDHQKVKVKLTSKTKEGFEFKSTGEHDRDTAQTGGEVEFKFNDPNYGTYTESWDLKNNISSRFEHKKMVNNRPVNFEVGLGMFPFHENNFGADGTIKYSHRNASFVCSGKYKDSQVLTNHSAVLGTSGAFIGGRVEFNVSNKELQNKELMAGMCGKSHQLTVAMLDNMDKLKCSIHHEVNSSLSVGVKGQYVFSEERTSMGGAFKYALNDVSTIRGTLNNCGLLGLSFRHAIKPCVALVFNSEFDLKNFQAGNHRSGLSIEFSP